MSTAYRADPPFTIGEFEQLAGIEDRAAFWAPYARHYGDQAFAAATAELTQRIADRIAGNCLSLLYKAQLPKSRRWRGPRTQQTRVIPQ